MAKEIEIQQEIKLKTIGSVVKSQDETAIPFKDGELEVAPPGGKKPEKVTIFIYSRDVELIRKYKQELKKSFGKVSTSEIFRFALNSVNIKRFKTGY